MSSLSGHTRSTSHWPDWLTKASTLLYHVRVPALTIVLYSHSTMVKRRTEHASSQPRRDLRGRYVVNSQCAFPCQWVDCKFNLKLGIRQPFMTAPAGWYIGIVRVLRSKSADLLGKMLCTTQRAFSFFHWWPLSEIRLSVSQNSVP